MLTGDKVETAKTIGFSCELLTEQMKLYEIISRDKIDAHISEVLSEIKQAVALGKNSGQGVVISGDALIDIMKSKELQLKVKSQVTFRSTR